MAEKTLVVYELPYPMGGVNLELLREEAMAAPTITPKPWAINKTTTTCYCVQFVFENTAPSQAACQAILDAHDPSGKTVAQRARDLKNSADDALANMPGWMDITIADALALWDTNVVPNLTSAGFSATSRIVLRSLFRAVLLMRDAFLADDVASQT